MQSILSLCCSWHKEEKTRRIRENIFAQSWRLFDLVWWLIFPPSRLHLLLTFHDPTNESYICAGQLGCLDNYRTVKSIVLFCQHRLYMRQSLSIGPKWYRIGDIHKLQSNSLSGFAAETGFLQDTKSLQRRRTRNSPSEPVPVAIPSIPRPRRSRRRNYKIIYIKIWNQIYSLDVEKDRWRCVT